MENGNLNGIKGEIARGIKDYSGCSYVTIDLYLFELYGVDISSCRLNFITPPFAFIFVLTR